MSKEILNPVIGSGPDKGRIADVELAHDMAYAEKSVWDHFMSDSVQGQLHETADLFRPELELEHPDKSPEELGKLAYKMAIEFDGLDVRTDAERATNKVLRAYYRNRVENQRARNYKRPASAGLPTLGKRR